MRRGNHCVMCCRWSSFWKIKLALTRSCEARPLTVLTAALPVLSGALPGVATPDWRRENWSLCCFSSYKEPLKSVAACFPALPCLLSVFLPCLPAWVFLLKLQASSHSCKKPHSLPNQSSLGLSDLPLCRPLFFFEQIIEIRSISLWL